MSTWNLGIDDVSEETRTLRDKLASKDGHIAAQQDRLVKQTAELDEMKDRLNEALHKLDTETKRALQLETDLQHRSEDLRNEKIASENIKTALVSVQEKSRGTNLEMRQLESTLERISHISDEHNSRGAKLEREKTMLEARVRELESNLREVTQLHPTTTPGHRIARPRSSSLSNFRITTLEQDLLEVRGLLAKKETDLQAVSQKLVQVQRDLIQADNEKSAMERKWSAQVEALQASMEDKEEELTYLREQQGDASREDELLKRIEEDDAKIAALGLMLRGQESSKELKERFRRVESQLKEEQQRLAESEEHRIQLVREKEEALHKLEEVRQESQLFVKELQDRKALDHALKEKTTKSLETCDDPLMNDDSCLIDMDTLEPSTPPRPAPASKPETEVDFDAIAQIERLLFAIDRLRGERDNLRRDVQFLESESRFTIEALEAKLLSASMSAPSSNQTMVTLDQMKAEMDGMHARLVASGERNAVALHAKNLEIKRLAIQVQGLGIALGHTASGAESLELLQGNLADIKELEERHNITVLCLEATVSQRDDLLNQLQGKDADWEKYVEDVNLAEQDARERIEEDIREIGELNNQLEAITSQRNDLLNHMECKDADWEKYVESLKLAEQDGRERLEEAMREIAKLKEQIESSTSQRDDLVSHVQGKDSNWEKGVEPHQPVEQDTRERLEGAMHEIAELSNQLEDIESERDSLTLQVTNLTTDLQLAQDELTNAESRYTNLQFHQLSSMTSNEATRTLRDHIEELEGRVTRRNELVGILQHDIRRLDTNLRLQEERLGEMTTELEMMAAQKDAMVEDCADAREARDEALGRVEVLEEEVENLEGRHGENKMVIKSLIMVVAETVSRARNAIRHARDQATGAQKDLSTSQQERLTVQQELDEKISSLLELTKQSDEHRDELQKVKLALAQCQTEAQESSLLAQNLQEEKVKLQSGLAAFREKDTDATILNLQTRNKELEDRLQETERVDATNEDSERNLVQLKLQHAEALGVLQGRLVETESALEELQTRYKASEDNRQRAQDEAKKSLHDLQQQLETTMKTVSELEQIHDQVDSLEKDHTEKLSELQEQLDRATRDRQEALDSFEALGVENEQLAADLDRLQQEQDALRRSESDKLAVQMDLERKVQSLQGRFEEENRLLEISREEVARLDGRVQEEVDGRACEQKTHAIALASANEQHERAQQSISKLRDELVELQKNLQKTQASFATVEEEKTNLQQEITTLEADIQKSKSLDRYLESQIKDSENLIATLRSDLDRLKSELAHSEKSWKAAEVNLSLQNAQHKRETAEFQRELSSFRTRPNLEHALAELEERNSDMEELLRAKCTEIEENDDRVLEMLKEKKKLTAKVESLNRKVQNLQAKLAAAKASNPAPLFREPQSNTPPLASPPSVSLAAQIQTPQPVSAAFSRPRSATLAPPPPPARSPTETPHEIKRKSSTRVVSGPSSLPRPKTPERSRTITPVFKARTPERHVTEGCTPDRRMTEWDPLPSAVVIGKKRSAPDDFEACENIPVQAFTADGEDVENRTPRVRRMLNSLQSGFTPIRHQNNRPTVPMPSPRRSVAPTRTSPQFISDLTNSPYQNIPQMPMPTSSAKPSSKRSWLGKIRGSSQSVDKPSSMKSMFDRGESS